MAALPDRGYLGFLAPPYSRLKWSCTFGKRLAACVSANMKEVGMQEASGLHDVSKDYLAVLLHEL